MMSRLAQRSALLSPFLGAAALVLSLQACSANPDAEGTGAAGGAANAMGGAGTNHGSGGASTQAGGNASGGSGLGGLSAMGGATTAAGGVQSDGGSNERGGSQSSSGGSASGGSQSGNGGASNGGSQTAKGGSGNGGSGSGGRMASGGGASGGIANGGAGNGGISGTGGATGGAGGGMSTPDCNSVTGETIIRVAKDGSGQYSTVQAAVNSVSSSNTTPIQLRIKPGTYKEKLVINRPYLTLCGEAGKASSTILTYSDNANTSNGNGGTLGTSGGTSVNLSSSNVSVENITFENSTPLGGSQAVALLVTGNRVQFRNCRFISYQDTLYVKGGTQYFKSCYVSGSVDFIFGGATAVFDGCTVHSAAGGISATAPSTDQATPYGLVFLGGELTAASGVSSVALGRNWGAYGAAAFIKTALGAHINPVGWLAMGSNTLDTARFSEFQTTGSGASAANLAKRARQSTQLTSSQSASYTVSGIFGAWKPSFSQ